MKNYCEWCHQADDWSCPKIEVRSQIGHLVHCPKCHREILLVTITHAARIAGVSTQTIYDWIRKGWTSAVTSAAGRKMVCHSSLYRPPKPETGEDAYVEALSEGGWETQSRVKGRRVA